MNVLLNNKTYHVLNTFDSLNTPAFVIDEKFRIVSLNYTARGFFQNAHDDVTGMEINNVISLNPELDGKTLSSLSLSSPEDLPGPTPASAGFESVCIKKNGETFHGKISFMQYHKDGQGIVIVQDISNEKKLLQKSLQRTKELSVFSAFAEILTRSVNAEIILEKTIDMLQNLMDVDSGWIYLIDEEAKNLHLAARSGLTIELTEGNRKTKPAESFNNKVLTSGRPLLVRKASEDPRVTYSNGIESIVGIPISSKGIVLGVLGVGSMKSDYFTSMDIQLLKTIGCQLGVAIENADLIRKLQDKMREIELINELSSIINSSLSIGTLFRIMMSEIKRLIDYDRASLLLYNEKSNNLLIFALDTGMKTVIKRGVKAPVEGTSAGWVIKNNRAWINYDLKAEKRFPADKKLADEGIRSTISIPLFQDKILGVFNLDSTTPSRYSEKDLRMLLPVAKHISIALENSLLFEEISREKKEWEKTFDAITDMVWMEDGRQRIIRANQTLLIKTGLTIVEVAGQKCSELLSKIGISSAEYLCSDTVHAKKPLFRELKSTGGSIFYFWAYPLIDDEGQLYAVVHYLKDVTAQKRLEQQLLRADKLASLGTLVAGIAHEINNPLGIIAGYSEALIERADDKKLLDVKEFEDFPEYLRTIHNEIFRCKRILKSLLEFSRPSGGTFREIDINELIKEVILLVNHKAARLKHNIKFRLNRDLPKICADPGSLRQLFMNIIINSMYFTPEGRSITITTEMGTNDYIRRFGTHTDTVKVSIADTGEGIPADIIDRIFDPFLTTKPVGEGTGLGLSICHKIVEDHEGSIEVESELGKGTVFTIRLPAKTRYDKSTCS